MGSWKLLAKRIAAGVWFLNLTIGVENHARYHTNLALSLLSDLFCVISFVMLLGLLSDLFAGRSSRGGEDA